jgi:hypothetical protein
MQMVATSPSKTCTINSIHDTITHKIHTNPKWRKAKSGNSTAINVLTIQEKVSTNRAFTPTALMEFAVMHGPTKFEHYANPVVHPVTGETISSYKKLMNDPAMAEVWLIAFSKDFGGMAQGNNKTGQKGTNAMFVMTHDEIAHVLRVGKVFTYANPVVDHRPRKEDPNRIQTTAGGNLINYKE